MSQFDYKRFFFFFNMIILIPREIALNRFKYKGGPNWLGCLSYLAT